MGRRRMWRWLLGLCLLAGAVALATALRTKLTPAGESIPTTEVKRGNLDVRTYATGELSAQHFDTLIAPPIGGGTLQITHLTPTGTPVKAGDLVIEFGPSEQQYKVEQNESQLQQAEQEIAKAQ